MDPENPTKSRGFNVNSIIIAIATFVICYALKWLGGVVLDSQQEVAKMNITFISVTEKINDIKDQMKTFATKQDLEAAQKTLEAKQLQFQLDTLKQQQPPQTNR